MTNEGLKISYGDVAVGAKENFAPNINSSEIENFVDITQLNKYNLNFPNYANPCEYGVVLLDSTSVPFPALPQEKNMGIWFKLRDISKQNPIVLTLTGNGQYSSQGFTFTFDTYNNIYCTDMDIIWYRNDEIISQKNFTPDSAMYFCNNKVENFTKIVVKFNGINLKTSRLKLRSIDYGYGTFFKGDVLRDVNVVQEISPISSELPISSVDFTLDSNTDIEYSFQSKQPIKTYFNGELVSTTFVSESKRTSKTVWTVETEDYVSQLSKNMFVGDIYTDKSAVELLKSIFSQVKIPLEIDSALNDEKITGYIPFCDCREAVRQICFAIGATCITANRDNVYICKLSSTIQQNIPLSRIKMGQSYESSDKVTEVKIISHNYDKMLAEQELYKASESGTGDEIFVNFQNPMHDLTIKNGEILKDENGDLKCSANYAIIKADTDCVLKGREYGDFTYSHSKRNPIVGVDELENIVEISDATLINNSNVETVLLRIFDNAIKTNTVNLSIYEDKKRLPDTGAIYGVGIYGKSKFGEIVKNGWSFDSPVKLGDVITCETEYMGTVTGRICSQRYKLNGGIILKECELY